VTKELTERQKAILESVFGGSDATRWIAEIQSGILSNDKIDEACDLLSAEFHMNGIDENFEANNYGREIQWLINFVNLPRLK
jgi:hypothetical protein